jgi:hypothetical protein
MTATTTEPPPKNRSMRACVVLLLLLIPLAAGALWVAKYGSHGTPESCFIDRNGERATFNWYQYLRGRAEFRLRTFDLDSNTQVSQEGVLHRIVRAGDSWAIGELGGGEFKLYRWNDDPSMTHKPIAFSIPAHNGGYVHPQAFIDGLVLATEVKADKTRIVLIDPENSQFLDEADVAGKVELTHWRQTNYVELRSLGPGGARTSARVKIDNGKITIDAVANTIYYVSPIDEFGQSYVFTISPDGKSMEVRSVEDNELRSSIELPNSLLNPLNINYYSGSSWVSLNVATFPALRVLSLDILSGKELPVPSGWTLRDRNRNAKRILVVAPSGTQAKLIDEVSGALIADVSSSGNFLGSKFIAGGEQILIASTDQRIMRYDARTGKFSVASPSCVDGGRAIPARANRSTAFRLCETRGTR